MSLMDSKIIVSDKEISNYFNNFTSVSEKKKILSSQKKHLSYLGPENSTIFLSPALPEDMEDLR